MVVQCSGRIRIAKRTAAHYVDVLACCVKPIIKHDRPTYSGGGWAEDVEQIVQVCLFNGLVQRYSNLVKATTTQSGVVPRRDKGHFYPLNFRMSENVYCVGRRSFKCILLSLGLKVLILHKFLGHLKILSISNIFCREFAAGVKKIVFCPAFFFNRRHRWQYASARATEHHSNSLLTVCILSK